MSSAGHYIGMPDGYRFRPLLLRERLATNQQKPCPPGGPAHDGRGGGKGMPGGDRKGARPK